MANSINVAKTKDIPAGSMKTVSAGGKKIAIANVDGQYFAVSDLCTHEECSLGTEGFLDGNRVTCGCHGSVFDVTNGKVEAMPATVPLQTYKVTVSGDDILIEV